MDGEWSPRQRASTQKHGDGEAVTILCIGYYKVLFSCDKVTLVILVSNHA